MRNNNTNDSAKILLIDEDKSALYLLRRAVNGENYRIYSAENGKQGLEMSAGFCPDLILMESVFEDVDGIQLIKQLRETTDCPILVLSEESNNARKVQALYAGADDYIEKPFHEEELKARMYVMLRRRIPCGMQPCYHANNLQIDFSRRQVTLSGENIHFSPMEYRILEYLALNSGMVVTYQMLLEKIWGPYAGNGSRILRVNMANIRKKIEQTPVEQYITTIPRVGYRMLESQSMPAF